MATRNHTEASYLLDRVIDTWAGLLNTDAGDGAGYAGSGQRSIQLNGTWGAGGTCIVEGSNDGGTTWFQLNDLGGTALSFSANGLKGIREDAVLIRPRVTGGDGTTNLTAILSIRRNTKI